MPRKYKTTKKKTTRKTAKGTSKPKDQEMEFADGRVEDQHKISVDIEAILATRSSNPFGTTSTDEFDSQVSEMNLTQMQELAVKASVFPSGNKTSLKNKLKREFKSRFGHGGETKYSSQTEGPVLDSDKAQEILEILNS